MTGIERGHIVISIAPSIWSEMKLQYDQLCSNRSITLVLYRGDILVRSEIDTRGARKRVIVSR